MTRTAIPALLLAFFPFNPTVQAAGPYDGYRIVVIDIQSQREFLTLSQLATPLACIPGPGPSEFLVTPEALPLLEATGVKHTIITNDAQALIDEETQANQLARADRGASFFSAYRSLDEINAYLDTLDSLPTLPPDFVTRFPIGQSIENRTVYALRFSAPSQPGAPPKPTFLITAGQHAREWINVSTGLYIADRLIRSYNLDPSVTAILDTVEFVYVPVVNPDGYVHTFPINQGGGGDRFWRKNRRNNGSSFGVDTNRNWSFQWGGPGASSSPSSETYRGAAPFSEPETQNIRNLVEGNALLPGLPNLKALIDLHSFSQLVLGPWGFTTTNPPRLDELDPLTSAQVSAISSTHSMSYIGGPAAQVLYFASGVAPDWAFGVHNALAWTYELRPIGPGAISGFSIPPDQIIPTGEEAFAGIIVLANHLQLRLQFTLSTFPNPLPLLGGATISVDISPLNNYALVPDSPRLFTRIGNTGDFTDTALSPSTSPPSSTFTATLPSPPCGETLFFYFQATASDGSIVTFPSQAPLSTIVAAAPPCPDCLGDADGDRVINFVDITAILSRWSATGLPGPPNTIGDANFDGAVNFADITATLSHWGEICP